MKAHTWSGACAESRGDNAAVSLEVTGGGPEGTSCADVSLKVTACAESCAADVTACAADVTEVLSPHCGEILKN